MATVLSLLALQMALALFFVGGKAALETVPPLTLEAARRLVATVILFAIVARREGVRSLLPRRRDLGDAVLPGVLGFGLGRASVMVGLSMTSSTNVALVDACAPAVALILASAVALERPRRLAIFGSLVALGGVAAFILAGAALSLPTGGELVVLGSPLSWGLIYVWVARRTTSSSLLRRTAWFSAAGALALAVPGFVLQSPATIAMLGSAVVLPVLALGIVVGVVENGLTFRAVGVIGAVATAEFEYLVPVLAAAAGLLLLGVPVTAMQLIAGAVVLGGMAVSGRARAAGADDSVVRAGQPCCVT
ncbi:MAG TPA: DMT family transporter [Candidatus Limnocylindrales bacterium]